MKTVEETKLPEQSPRVETGILQFGGDWPGVFIRGDQAYFYALHLKGLLDHVKNDERFNAISYAYLEGFVNFLNSSDIRNHKKTAPEGG